MIRRCVGPLTILGLLACPVAPGQSTEPARRQGPDQVGSARPFHRLSAPRERVVEFVHRVKNQGKTPLRQVDVAIAVPRSNARQQVQALQFDPRPERLSRDGWEQETAHFQVDRIEPGEVAEIRLEIKVTLFDVEFLVAARDVGPADEVPERIARHYLRNSENYQLGESVLLRVAEKLDLKDGPLLERVRRIHDFVIDAIDYNRDDRWEAADTVLRQGSGSCSEYSYLLIALCRLHGIPARYAGGTWFEKDGISPPRGPAAEARASVDRVFHRWVEVYLPRVGWFPVDPTQNDRADQEGDPYRYFGKLPWSYLAMTHGDGDKLESGQLGWDYRSNTRWLRRPDVAEDAAVVERFAVWKTSEKSPVVASPGN